MKFDYKIIGEITEGLTFYSFTSFLEEYKKRRPAKVLLYSSGGSGETAGAINDMMSLSKTKIHIYCFGRVESSALIIMQAADKKFSSENCMFMSHKAEVSSNSKKNRKEHKKKLDLYDNWSVKIVSPMKILKKCSYYTAKEMKEMGLIDKIL